MTLLSLEPIGLHWIAEGSEETDLCAHGGLVIRYKDEVLVDDSTEDWALGPAMLMLLRALEDDHIAAPNAAEHLFPHCAHVFWLTQDGRYFTVGCPTGRDLDIRHRDSKVSVVAGQRRVEVDQSEWARAILRFSREVYAFYSRSPAKTPSADDAAGWESFWQEWAGQIQRATQLAGETTEVGTD